MLRSKQYLKLYKKYHSLNVEQSYYLFYVWQRAYNQLYIIKLIPKSRWRRLYEKNM